MEDPLLSWTLAGDEMRPQHAALMHKALGRRERIRLTRAYGAHDQSVQAGCS